jgi:hypothetical protein
MFAPFLYRDYPNIREPAAVVAVIATGSNKYGSWLGSRREPNNCFMQTMIAATRTREVPCC